MSKPPSSSSPPPPASPSPDGLARQLAAGTEKGKGKSGLYTPDAARPPAEFNIRIGRDGTWYYRETPIARKRMVQLFASVLQRDDEGRYWLVTPGDQGIIAVEDAPFTAVSVTGEGCGKEQVLRFRTNLDALVYAGPDNPIILKNQSFGEGKASLVPYLQMDRGLEARLLRPVYYELAERAVAEECDGVRRLGVWSDGVFFPLERPADGRPAADL